MAAVVAGGVVAGLSGAFGGPGHANAGVAGNAYRTSTATVTRRSLTSQTQVAATLGDTGTYSVVNQAQGTITELPAVGQVVRQGQVLYQVSGSPVVLLYGHAGLPGPGGGDDRAGCAELNADLVGCAMPPPRQLDPTLAGITSAPRPPSAGGVAGAPGGGPDRHAGLGQAVFLPSAALITGLGTGTVTGGRRSPGRWC